MNGKDIIWSLAYVSDSIIEEAEYGVFPAGTEEGKRKARKGFRRLFLIAAIIGLLVLLMGCAAYFYRLKNLVVIDHTDETVAAAEAETSGSNSEDFSEALPETTSGPLISRQILSLQGYEGSPAYCALQEWLQYATEYTIQNPEIRFSDAFRRPEAYYSYPCYSQEMVEKVDEICGKYGLHLLGKPTFIADAEGMKEYGLSGVLNEDVIPRCFYGHLFQDGSFVAYGELEISEKTVQFQMHNIRKDAFYTVPLGLNDVSDFVQWNYTTSDGQRALLARNENTGLIFLEKEGRFISIIIEEVPDSNMVWTGLPQENHFLETVCDCFAFSDLENE